MNAELSEAERVQIELALLLEDLARWAARHDSQPVHCTACDVLLKHWRHAS